MALKRLLQALEVHDGVEAAAQAAEGGDFADGEHGAVDVGPGAGTRFVAQDEFLVFHTEDDFGGDDVAGEADGVYLGAVEARAAGLGAALNVFEGHVEG